MRKRGPCTRGWLTTSNCATVTRFHWPGRLQSFLPSPSLKFRHVRLFPFQLLNQLRPGALLRARRLLGGKPGQLRVRYTTPARYYSPGALVTTLAIGVDEADWQSLMAGTRRI